MSNKQFLVIGLGRFGSAVAKTLFTMGHDVLAIDIDEDIVQEISDHVTHAIQLDATDESALKTIGINNFDVAVVTIGSNIQASVMITLVLKELGIKFIVCKGDSDLHAKVLYKIGADRVIQPEKDMGTRVAHNLASSNILDYIELSPEYSIIEIEAPREWFNHTLKELNLRSKYGLNVMAIKHNSKIKISLTAEDVIKENDIIVAMGSSEELSRLERLISKIK
ncbi:TrkA family potassium uptake protein [Clostridium intestinale]|uniref:potassium channel family protein n=1 Tax=Clostridium intestinale TaxID=36845 RepID=UPI002DD64DFD|nr:TrkA family potassium uptake protein [Clostridium intestinale]WRY53445.1 TrkA family potassium uptake protein [Clostridium intestinale]